MTSLQGLLPHPGSTNWRKNRTLTTDSQEDSIVVRHVVIREVWLEKKPWPHAVYLLIFFIIFKEFLTVAMYQKHIFPVKCSPFLPNLMVRELWVCSVPLTIFATPFTQFYVRISFSFKFDKQLNWISVIRMMFKIT